MKNSMFLCTTAMAFVAAAATAPAAAQTTVDPVPSAATDQAPAEDADIIVTGVRASLASAH